MARDYDPDGIGEWMYDLRTVRAHWLCPGVGRGTADVSSGALQVECGDDQRNVRKRLRKVTHHAPAFGVVLLGEKPNIVAKPDQTFKQSACVLGAAEGVEAADHPEAACEEDALAGWQTVLGAGRVVTED